MPALFCLRLACGLVGALLLLNPAQINPRFYRVHFLTALGLVAAVFVLPGSSSGAGWWLALGSSAVLAFVGSVVWSLEGAPGGRGIVVLCVATLGAAVGLAGHALTPTREVGALLADELTASALLGVATTAMLMGHSYLIAPTMSLTPLLRLLAALFVVVFLRMGVATVGLCSWTAEHSLGKLDEVTIWLPLRWGLGFLGPLLLGWFAWQTARIRSTQSATGILYVVVIFCFLGELTSQLLLGITGYTL